MLETLTNGFRNARLKLQGKARLSEDNVSEALRDVRVALLEADVELGVVKAFLGRVGERSLGEVVPLKAKRDPRGMTVTPGDHFVRICHDELVALMGPADAGLDLSGSPALIMMVGLQGSGKTTTAGKLARKLAREGRRPMLVAADIYRPAAIDQLTVLGRKLGVPVFSIKGMQPVQLCELAVQQAKNVGRDVLIFDTAGRLAIDERLMEELEQIRERTRPDNVLFVCDAMIGQDAVRTAAGFDARLGFTGFVLTKLDGDARGGAALSIKEVTGKPIKLLGMGEGLDKLEEFRPEGLAQRILGMGDVVGLVRDLEEHVDEEEADLKQLEMLRKMGSIRDLLEKLPGFSDLEDQIPAEALDDREMDRGKAIIQSMTLSERGRPELLEEPGRVRRVARGCGRDEQDVRDLYQRFLQTRDVMKGLGQMGGMFGGGNRAARRAGAPLGAMGMPGLPGLPGVGEPEPERPQLSAAEKKARKKKQREKRRARKKQRKKR